MLQFDSGGFTATTRSYRYTKRGASIATAPTKKKRKKEKMSAEGLANIIAAQKKRWAKVKREKAKEHWLALSATGAPARAQTSSLRDHRAVA